MSVYELNRDQLISLKQSMVMERCNERGEDASYGELADADETISDNEVFEEYAGTNFVEEDFI